MVKIIAEIGVNHNGSLDMANRLIDAAKSAGADAVKLQAFCADTLEPPGNRRDMLRRFQLSDLDLEGLCKRIDGVGMEAIVTPFGADQALWMKGKPFRTVKVASSSLRDEELLRAVKDLEMDVIISTGMSTIQDIGNALHIVGRERTTLLQCTSAYPAPIDTVNLRAMATLADIFNVPVGLSDHSRSIYPPIAAVSMGATVIEAHLTLDCELPGPDHNASLEPSEFSEMVLGIRTVERAMGDGRKRPVLSEAYAMQIRDEREAWRTSQNATSSATADTVA